MFEHEDVLAGLSQPLPLSRKLEVIHRAVRERLASIERIAVALYDGKTDLLETFVCTGPEAVLDHYQASLSESPSLLEIYRRGRPRVVNDLRVFESGAREHTRRIGAAGFAASYTLPLASNGRFLGFVFFNARYRDPFSEDALYLLDVFGHLIGLAVAQELETVETLVAAVHAARSMTHHRDVETGAHIERMARFARVIATELAAPHGFSDEYVEQVFLGAPLHDVGKIGIPDAVLHKPGQLDGAEREVMQQHVAKGREILEHIAQAFGLDQSPHFEVMRNIVEFHHEAVDGSGYLRGLAGDEIPIETRIVAVADVFDALASRRPYKAAWPNDKAFATLRMLAGSKLDAECVAALVKHRDAVEDIQRRFRDGVEGADRP